MPGNDNRRSFTPAEIHCLLHKSDKIIQPVRIRLFAEPDAAPAMDKSAAEQPGTKIDDRPGEPDAPQPEAPATLRPPESDDAQPQARANLQPEESHFAQPQAAESLQASISARLITAIEGEMAKLNREIPAHKSKLAVLQRSLSFALPELVRLVRQGEPTPPKEIQLAIHDKFQDAVLQLIAKQPEDRYQTPSELLSDLDRIGRYNNLNADWSGWSG